MKVDFENMNEIMYRCLAWYAETGFVLGFCVGVWGGVLWQYAELHLCWGCSIKNNHGDVFELTPDGQTSMLQYFAEYAVLG